MRKSRVLTLVPRNLLCAGAENFRKELANHRKQRNMAEDLEKRFGMYDRDMTEKHDNIEDLKVCHSCLLLSFILSLKFNRLPDCDWLRNESDMFLAVFLQICLQFLTPCLIFNEQKVYARELEELKRLDKYFDEVDTENRRIAQELKDLAQARNTELVRFCTAF